MMSVGNFCLLFKRLFLQQCQPIHTTIVFDFSSMQTTEFKHSHYFVHSIRNDLMVSYHLFCE